MNTAPRFPSASLSLCALLGCVLLGCVLVGCGGVEHDHGPDSHVHGDEEHAHDGSAAHGDPDDHAHGGSLALLAWGEHFEVFPEMEPLVAGEPARAHTHVTLLESFAPLRQGTVAVVLRDRSGEEQVFRATEPVAPGIFDVSVEPERVGRFHLSFRIQAEGLQEEVAGGRVEVGTAGFPGEVLEPPPSAPPAASPGAAGEPVSFTKEQQWSTAFATARVERGSLQRAVQGAALVRPVAGGEVLLTAPVAGRVEADRWPHPGSRVTTGGAVVRIVPTASRGESLAALEARLRQAEAELAPAQARLERLRQLAEVEAVSRGEVGEAEARVVHLEARLDAAGRDLASARSVRSGEGKGEALAVRAPWSGEVAAVRVTPGEVVEAGAPLVRLLRPRPLWLEVALEPRAVARLEGAGGPAGLILWPGGDEPVAVAGAGLRWVAAAPEVSGTSGTVPVLVEVAEPPAVLRPGLRLEAAVLLPESREGVVISSRALVDDGGVPVVYLQIDGESFLRREVTVVARQGDRALVVGLEPGERLVTRGGGAVRRASLMASGAGHGHIH